ncbi:MAG: hypothetical protein C0622_02370 [Desulfuromonas sp.]|nr:MAG: hypothetical protein C0622_02370 [Desulfuromonas sp.]
MSNELPVSALKEPARAGTALVKTADTATRLGKKIFIILLAPFIFFADVYTPRGIAEAMPAERLF